MERKVIILPFDGYSSAAALHKVIASMPLEVWDMTAFIKLNDGVHNSDEGGPKTVDEIRMNIPGSVGIFLDLKVYDVSATLVNVLKKYHYAPDILTVSSQCSVNSIIELRKLLPNTKLAMVSMLTDIGENECFSRFGSAPEEKILNDLLGIFAVYSDRRLKEPELPKEPFDLIVCSPKEVEYLKTNLPASYGFIVPGIRDEWMKKASEHQKRTTGVGAALNAGATFVVMGAQMTKGNPELSISPEASRALTLAEIKKVL